MMCRFRCYECHKPIDSSWWWKYPCTRRFVCQKCARSMLDPHTPFPLIMYMPSECDGNRALYQDIDKKRQFLPGINETDTTYEGLEVEHE